MSLFGEFFLLAEKTSNVSYVLVSDVFCNSSDCLLLADFCL